MNLGQRVEHLELQYESLDGTVHKILSFTKNTHEILMEHVAETRKRFDQQDKRFDQQDKRLDRLESDMSEVKSMLKQLLAR